MKVSELDYELPSELIAQRPLERRDDSRLLVYDRASGEVAHRRFSELPEQLEGGELVVANDTRVIPARIRSSTLAAKSCCWNGVARTASGRRSRGPPGVSSPVAATARSSCSSTSARGAGCSGSTVSRPARRRCRRTSRSARRSRALPDRLRRRGGLGRRADRRTAFHAGAPGAARRRARHPPCRARHLPTRVGGRPRRAPAAR